MNPDTLTDPRWDPGPCAYCGEPCAGAVTWSSDGGRFPRCYDGVKCRETMRRKLGERPSPPGEQGG